MRQSIDIKEYNSMYAYEKTYNKQHNHRLISGIIKGSMGLMELKSTAVNINSKPYNEVIHINGVKIIREIKP